MGTIRAWGLRSGDVNDSLSLLYVDVDTIFREGATQETTPLHYHFDVSLIRMYHTRKKNKTQKSKKKSNFYRN